MYKVEDQDEIQNWLNKESLPVSDEEDNNDAQITVEIAHKLVLQFWPSDVILKLKNKIDPLYKPHLWYLFMIGSPAKAPNNAD